MFELDSVSILHLVRGTNVKTNSVLRLLDRLDKEWHTSTRNRLREEISATETIVSNIASFTQDYRDSRIIRCERLVKDELEIFSNVLTKYLSKYAQLYGDTPLGTFSTERQNRLESLGKEFLQELLGPKQLLMQWTVYITEAAPELAAKFVRPLTSGYPVVSLSYDMDEPVIEAQYVEGAGTQNWLKNTLLQRLGDSSRTASSMDIIFWTDMAGTNPHSETPPLAVFGQSVMTSKREEVRRVMTRRISSMLIWKDAAVIPRSRCDAQIADPKGTTRDTWCLLYRPPIAISRSSENWSLYIMFTIRHSNSSPSSTYSAVAAISGFPPPDHEPPEKETHDMDRLDQLLRANRELVNHPFCLMLIVMDMITEKDSSEVHRHSENIYSVERRTRLRGFEETYDIWSLPPADQDLQKYTAMLNSAVSRLAFHQLRLESNIVALEELQNQLPPELRHMQYSILKSEDSLMEYAGRLHREMMALHRSVLFNIEIAKTQLQVLYTMVAQRDNREARRITEASVKVAEASRIDSSIMKSLAVLGAVFLPGTFISALFSMRMFNWLPEPGLPTVSRWFWIYWVITVPLTAIVLLFIRRNIQKSSLQTVPKSEIPPQLPDFPELDEKPEPPVKRRFPWARQKIARSSLAML